MTDIKATTHVTAGAGLSLSRNLEVNLGGDFASKKRIVSASAVVRF